MTQTFTIPGRLPSLNDLIHAMNHNRFAGAKVKREAETLVAYAARAAHVKPLSGAFRISVTWHEPNNLRDRDNVVSGVKFILDALQPMSRRHPRGIGIIPGDGAKHMPQAPAHDVQVDRANPRIVVTLTPIGDTPCTK